MTTKPAKFLVRQPPQGKDPRWLPAYGEESDEDLESLRDRLKIDKDALDDECMGHPELFRQVSEKYAIAVAERDTAKEHLAATDARLAETVRKTWANTGEKTTEDRVKNAVAVHPEHAEAHRAWVAKGRRAGILDGLRQAVESRGWMLRELAHLYAVGYFEVGAAKGGSRTYDGARAQEARDGMAAARKERQGAKAREGKGTPS